MNGFLSAVTSDIAIVIYLSIAIIIVFLFIVKYTKRLKQIKKQDETDKVKIRDDILYQSLLNEKRGKK